MSLAQEDAYQCNIFILVLTVVKRILLFKTVLLMDTILIKGKMKWLDNNERYLKLLSPVISCQEHCS